ncbi:acetylcholinesterase-1-like isoform X2 [Dermacentor andersoni]|uniref:acetylcholinesterase-1-like isoform X2 n=1 Tax=Dermacentor andersoni TaxID=34620 RepID=UPI0021559357|nr:acetylcholinesterase-1-like isoform X2 [Dermacentor andersoni]
MQTVAAHFLQTPVKVTAGHRARRHRCLIVVALVATAAFAAVGSACLPYGVEAHSEDVESSAPIVQTDSGPVAGIRLRGQNGGVVDAYLGIPFAKPPTGERRFMLPEPITPWKETLQAVWKPKACVQTSFELPGSVNINTADTSEDCLYLNIWVPRPECSNGAVSCDHLLPVFTFVYGGLFVWGSSALGVYDGLDFAARAQVVYANFNYRVSLFGFLNASSPEAPGNMGMYDQLEALRWIHRNIKHFGGDPDAITLAGHSAGGMSVSYHIMSELSRGLFKRAALFSGTPQALSYSDHADQHQNFRTLSYHLGCADAKLPVEAQRDEIVRCMRKWDAHKLALEATKALPFKFVTILPGYGDAFLRRNPLDLNNPFNVKEIFLGTTQDDGAYLVYAMLDQLKWLNGNLDGPTVFRVTVKSFFNVDFAASAKYSHLYFDESGAPHEQWEIEKNLSLPLTEGAFDCGTDLYASSALASNVTLLRYEFTHRPARSMWHKWVTATHMDELPFFLATTDKLSSGTTRGDEYAKELQFSNELVDTLASFTKTGKPKIPKSDMEWPKYTKESKAYVILKPNDYSVAYGPRSKKCHLWEPYLVKRQPSPTTPAPKHKPTPKRMPEKRPGKPLRPLDNFVESSASTGPLSSATALASMLFAIALGRS